MNVRILQLTEGAKQARGLTVIIDVFRAMTVETFFARGHAAKILPMATVEEALAYKAAHPDAILCGERNGVQLDGFDYGNSPSQLEGGDFTGKTVVHTTSAGTQGIAAASGADEIIAGSLVSALAIAEYIKRRNPEEVSLVCMGWNAQSPTEEDTLCAEYIRDLLSGSMECQDIWEKVESLAHTSGAKFFDPAQQSVFPERDFRLCIQVNSCPFVLRLGRDEETGLPCMERVEVMNECRPTRFLKDELGETSVKPGDWFGRFTMNEVLCFPDNIKREIAYGDETPAQGYYDATLVLGGPEKEMEPRARAAAEFYHAGQTGLLVPTGGVYWDSPFGCLTEAEILSRYMQQMGVPREAIYVEDRATTTRENMINSYKMLKDRFGDQPLRVAVASSSCHVWRSLFLARAYMPDAALACVRANIPLDNPAEYLQSVEMQENVNHEVRCLWGAVKDGLVPDFQLGGVPPIPERV